MKRIVAVAIGLLACSVSSVALAEGPEREFGNPGVLAIEADTSANLGFTSTSGPGNASTNDIDFRLEPSAQYFVIEGLSIGGTVLLDVNAPKNESAVTTFGIGPTVGYNLWLSPGSLSLWPQVTFSFNTTKQSETVGNTTTDFTVNTTNLGVYVPLLIHPVRHFHIGVGPYANFDLSNSESAGGASVDGPKNTNIGIKLDIGGWL